MNDPRECLPPATWSAVVPLLGDRGVEPMLAPVSAHLLPQVQRDMAARSGATTSSVRGSHFTPLVRASVVVDLVEQARTAVNPHVVRETR